MNSCHTVSEILCIVPPMRDVLAVSVGTTCNIILKFDYCSRSPRLSCLCLPFDANSHRRNPNLDDDKSIDVHKSITLHYVQPDFLHSHRIHILLFLPRISG
jgi:hypothetical protein